jgi:tungstate transport system substrate-binding protein
MRTAWFAPLLALAALVAAACGPSQAPAPAPTPAAPAAKAEPPKPSDRRVRLVTTTSVRDTGLLDALLPEFTKETGVGVDVIAVGTGAAFQHGRDGNADLLLVHDRKGEEEFVAGGDGRERRDLMWNTFEIAGPADDPAGVKGAASGAEAFARIAKAGAPFVSRGDDSGTHRKEKKLWEKAGAKAENVVQTGQGMGPTLLVAHERNAYVLTDRGTRLAYRRKLDLVPLVADTADLRNDYAIVVLSPARHPDLAHAEAGRLADWFLSAKTLERIAAFQVEGESLFHPVPGK